jgi:hypothetical protein
MSQILALCLIFFTAGILLLNSWQQLSSPLYSNDFNAWLMPVAASLRGLGVPFKDYWAIEPPALFLMTTIWGFFSTSLAWFHVLRILLEISICFCWWYILQKTFPKIGAVILYVVGLLTFFSPTVQSMFFASELNGTFFVLLGLVVLLRPNKLGWQAFWAALAFGLAGQMKEVFAFSVFALIPLYMKASLRGWKVLLQIGLASLAGMAVMLGLTLGYLLSTGSLTAYREVMTSKSETFHITDLNFILRNGYQALQFPIDRFVLANYALVLIVAVALASGWAVAVFGKYLELKVVKKIGLTVKTAVPPNLYAYAVLAFYWLGMWFGYTAQNRYGNKYDMAALLSTHALLGLAAVVISAGIIAILKSLNWVPRKLVSPIAQRGVLLIILAVLILPNKTYFLTPVYETRAFHPSLLLAKWKNLENPELIKLELAIKARTSANDCIQGVYGWGIGNLFYYAQRKPCTRFTIPNIVTPNQVAEYRQSLVAHPPQALLYATGGADLNMKEFEQQVFDYSQVRDNCYSPDKEFSSLYWPKTSTSGANLQDCVRKTLQQVKQL